MPLFEVDRGSARVAEIKPTTFPALGLWERQDLEAWVTSSPQLAGGDFEVVTSEYDRFDKTSERLDVLGIVPTDEGQGRLVIVELKRDGTSTTVDLQAIKYAAYVASCQFNDVVSMYASYHQIDELEAERRLRAVLGENGEEAPVIDDTPRIVLVAGDFRPEVTTTVLWLIDNYAMDIRCVRLQPFALDGRIIISSEVIIPLPEAEQYRLGVQRKRRDVIETQAKTKSGRLVPRLLEAGVLQIGDVLYLKESAIPPGTMPPWSTSELTYQAVVETSEGTRTLRWHDPESGADELVSPSLLAARFIWKFESRPGPVSSAGINGMLYWTIDGEKSLRDIATEHGLLDSANRTVDKAMLREVCNSIPAGRWSTYRDVATAIGVPGAAQSVAGVIAADPGIDNPHRILRANGQVSSGWTDPQNRGPEHAQSLLEAEGVSFDAAGIAAPDLRWDPATRT